MAETSHVIGSIQFCVDVSSREKATELFERISSISQHDLPKIIDGVLERFPCPPDYPFRIDALTLDIGDLSEENFESVLMDQIESALQKSLDAIWQSSMVVPGQIPSSRPISDLLAFLLEFGYMPWWAHREHHINSTLESLWLEMLSSNHLDLTMAIRQLLKDPIAQQRLVGQISATTIQQSVWILLRDEPNETTNQLLLELVAAWRVQFPEHNLESFIWATILRQQLQLPPGETSPLSIWENVTQQLAKRLDAKPAFIQGRLQAILIANKRLPVPLLSSIAKKLSTLETTAEVPTEEQQLLLFLETGLLPSGSAVTLVDLEQHLRAWIARDPERVKDLLRALHQKTDVVSRLSHQFSPELLPWMIERLFPEQLQWLRPFIQALSSIIETQYPGKKAEPRLWQAIMRTLLDNPSSVMSIQDLESNVLPSLSAALELSPEALRQLFRQAAQTTGVPDIGRAQEDTLETPAPIASEEEQLLLFLETGLLPSGSDVTLVELERHLRAWIARDPERVKDLLRALHQKTDVVSRLSHQFSPELLPWMIERLFMGQLQWLRPFIQALSSIIETRYPGKKAEPRLWQAIMRPLLDNPSSVMSIQDLESNVLPSLSAGLELSPEALRQLFRQAAQATGLSDNSRVQEEMLETPIPEAPVFLASEEEQLLLFLETGLLPSGSDVTLVELEQHLRAWIARAPEHVKDLLRALHQKTDVVGRLSHQFSPELLPWMIDRLFPGQLQWLLPFIQALSSIIETQYPGKKAEPRLWQSIMRPLLDNPSSVMSIQDLESNVIPSLSAALELSPEALRQLFRQAAQTTRLSDIGRAQEDTLETPAPIASEEEQLLLFLETGLLPSGSDVTLVDLEQHLRAWIARAPERVKDLLRALHQKTDVVGRLSHQFSPELLPWMIDRLFPGQLQWLLPFIQALSSIIETQYPGKKAEPRLWQSIMRPLLDNPSSVMSIQDLESNVLPSLSVALELSPEALRQLFRQAAQAIGLPDSGRVQEGMLEAPVPESPVFLASEEEQLLLFLETGLLPSGSDVTLVELEQHLRIWIARAPERVKDLLGALHQKTDVVGRLSHQFSPELLPWMIERLFPGPLQWLLPFIQALSSIIETQYPGKKAEPRLWQAIMRTLLDNPSSVMSIQDLESNVLPSLSVALELSPEVLRQLFRQAAQATGLSDNGRAQEDTLETPAPIASEEEQLLLFLETGLLPSGSDVTLVDLEQHLRAWIARAPEHVKDLLRALHQKTDVVSRLSHQFSPELLPWMIERLFPGPLQWLLPFIQALSSIIETQYLGKKAEPRLWQAIMRTLLDNPSSVISIQDMESNVLPSLSVALELSPEALRQLFRQAAQAIGLPDSGRVQEEMLEAPVPESPIPIAFEDQQLLLFLETGLLPSGSDVTLVELEQHLRAWIARAPERGKDLLLSLHQKTEVISRLSHQFSIDFGAWIIDTFSLNDLLFIKKATNSGTSEALKEKTAAAPTTPAQALFYYLEWSRLSIRVVNVSAFVEETLLTQIRQFPEDTRRELWRLNSKVDLAERLIQHIGLPAIQTVIHNLIPQQWAELETVLRDLSNLLGSRKEKAVPVALELWQTTLRQLLSDQHLWIDLPGLVAGIMQLFEEPLRPRLVVGQGSGGIPVAKQPGLGSSTVKYLTLVLGQLSETEQQAIKTDIDQWQQAWSREADAIVIARDKILFRLTMDQPAWWDQTEHSPDDLVNDLTKQSSAALKTALIALSSAGFQHKWLPQLSDATFHHLLNALWGGYADLAMAYLPLFGIATKDLDVYVDITKFRSTLFELAITSEAVNSNLLFNSILKVAIQESGLAEKNWRAALEHQAKQTAASGDLRFYRILEIISEPIAELPFVPLLVANKALDKPLSSLSRTDKPSTLGYADLLRLELQALTQYLRFGTLPMPTEAIAFTNAISLEHLITRLIDKHGELVLPLFRQAFQHQERAERLVKSIRGTLLHRIGSFIWGEPYFGQIIDLWSQLLDRIGATLFDIRQQSLNQYFYTFIFHQASLGATAPLDPLALAEGMIRMISEQEHIPMGIIEEHLRSGSPTMAQKHDLMEPLLPALLGRFSKDSRASKTYQQIQTGGDQTSKPIEEAIVVTNAGLVILAPYLPRYFGALDLLAGSSFKDPTAAERGVHLLQYLATNQTETAEHLLVLNKLLCGLPVTTPVSIGIQITSAEKELSDFLLNSILQNWEMMNSSSVANLQGAFLLREGLLREKEDHWQMNVEKKGYDIILDNLPWTISMVKLPWMDKRIVVEWKNQ